MVFRAVAAIRTALWAFRKNERGNVAMLFGIAAIPLVVAAGGVVDFSRIYYARTDLQDALDATALTLSKTAPSTPAAQLQKSAHDVFFANFRDMDTRNITVNAVYDSSGPQLVVTGNLDVQMYFMPLINLYNVPVQASSTVVWGETRLRISLVLDNTGSMADKGKMAALKAASHTLLDQLKTTAQKDGDVYVSIVPFSRDVTVDTALAKNNPAVIRWDLFGTCSSTTYKDQTACEKAGKKWSAYPQATWTGCVTDREKDPNLNYDTLNTPPNAGVVATLFPADRYAACPTPMMELSYDWAKLGARVDAMKPNGLTNQSIGLAWGWQSLTAAPFKIPAKQPGIEYREVIILLSDGLNTQNRWYSAAKQIDARQKILCDNVKNAKFDIFTVQVNTDNDPLSTLLRDCATDPSQFFLLTSANDIVTTFQQIATRLSLLRVSS